MPKRPLLIFPKQKILPRKTGSQQFGQNKYHSPDHSRQKDRLSPKFQSMHQAFLSNSADGTSPESVLVIETLGQIEEFQRAVRAIEGLHWMAEADIDVDPNEDFYSLTKIGKKAFSEAVEGISFKQSKEIWDALFNGKIIDSDGFLVNEEDIREGRIIPVLPMDLGQYIDQVTTVIKSIKGKYRQKALSGRLFLTMSNKNAMDQLLALYDKWKNPKKTLPHGYKSWEKIFTHTKDIRMWGTEDRLRETGVLDAWKEEIEIKRGTASSISFEIELWFRTDKSEQDRVQKELETLIRHEKGKILTTCKIDEIRFHALKAELPSHVIEKVLSHQYTQIFKSNDVMFFRPTGQCVAEVNSEEGEGKDFPSLETRGQPIAAILDGYPFVNHISLENALMLDDPDDFGSDYQENQRKHGTAMASLVCCGELDGKEGPLKNPVYFRPILKPKEGFSGEYVPENIFLEDLIERTVKRIFEGEYGEAAVASTIKVINLSIGDPAKMFFNQLSSTAKLLDWLSEKYQVLFCVSAGNSRKTIHLGFDEARLKQMEKIELLQHTLEALNRDIRANRLLSPADSINSITIGAIHTDQSTPWDIGNRLDIMPDNTMISPVSSQGHGFRNSVKPDICISGGRQLYSCNGNHTYVVASSGFSPGHRVATTAKTPGERNRTVFTRGTSNATALGTRAVTKIVEVLLELRAGDDSRVPDKNIAVLAKTLLVHGSSWGNRLKTLKDCLKKSTNSKDLKKTVSRFLGYGVPHVERVLECTAQRATVISSGSIRKDESHEFSFPLPSSLSGSGVLRRVIITLAWFSPINAGHRKIRKANLSFIPPTEKDIGTTRIEADGRQVKNGTIQHEILEGKKVVDYVDGETLKLAVVCREDAGNLDEGVRYGIAVTMEVAEGIEVPIYEEIRAGVEVLVAVEND